MTVALAIPAYLFLIAPAIGLAVIDKMLEQSRLRLFAVCILATVAVPLIFAHGSDGTPQKVLAFGLAGLVPTLICSLLANWKVQKAAPTA
jgi:peptidoglycan/LPS O-acetylase OafA/YrhL